MRRGMRSTRTVLDKPRQLLHTGAVRERLAEPDRIWQSETDAVLLTRPSGHRIWRIRVLYSTYSNRGQTRHVIQRVSSPNSRLRFSFLRRGHFLQSVQQQHTRRCSRARSTIWVCGSSSVGQAGRVSLLFALSPPMDHPTIAHCSLLTADCSWPSARCPVLMAQCSLLHAQGHNASC